MTREATSDKWRAVIGRYEIVKDRTTVHEFCMLEGVSTASFYEWKRRLREEGHEVGANDFPFTPVTVIGGDVQAIEIRFPTGAVMQLPRGDEQTLRQVTQLLLGDTP